MGCGRNWPTCNGEWLPTVWNRAVVIEYTHRLSVLSASILLVLLAVVALKKYGKQNEVRLYVAISLGGVVLEGALGALSVLFVNPPVVMAAHLGIALFSFVGVFLLTVTIREQDTQRGSNGQPRIMRPDPLDPHIVRWSRFMPVYAYAAIYLGAYVANTGTGAFFKGWLIPQEHGAAYLNALLLDSMHRLAALGFLLAAIRIVYLTSRFRRTYPTLYQGAWGILAFVLSQAVSGILLVETHLSSIAFLLHVTNATFLFTAVCYFARRTEHVQRADAPLRKRKLMHTNGRLHFIS